MSNLHGKVIPNGTGIKPSVNESNAPVILDYIFNTLKYNSIVDCGTGMGWLIKMGNNKVTGIEGNKKPILKKVCDQEILLGNLLDPKFMRTVDKADICTSFEVIEHIHEEDILQFFKNVQLISDNLFCSIHTGTTPIPGHILIKTEDWWNDFFFTNKIKHKTLADFGKKLQWNSSVCYVLNLKSINT